MLTLEDFDLGEVSILVTNADQTTVSIPVTTAMLSAEDLAKLATVGTHTITITYQGKTTTLVVTLVEDDLALELRPIYELGFSTGAITITYEQWIQSIRGADGEDGTDGREVTLRVSEGQIQWQYAGDSSWTNLIAVSSLIGPSGSNGTNGKEVTFQIAGGYLQWQYVGDAAWQNLLLLSTLAGTNGTTPTISISIDGFWVINEIKSEFRAVPETPIIDKVSLTFDCTGGSLTEEIADDYQNLNKGEIVTLPIPTKTGYVFAGWFTGTTPNDGQFTNTSVLVCNLHLVARWTPDYAPLIAILDTLANGKNFTLQNTISSEWVSGEKWVEEATILLSPDAENHKVTSFTLNIREYFDEVLISERLNEMKYFAIVNGEYEYLYRLKSDGNYFERRKITDGYLRNKSSYPSLDQPFEYLNPAHFTKRENENIFDYLEVDQYLYNFAEAIYRGSGVIDAMGLIASFNADTNELLISIPLLDSEDMDYEGIVQIRYHVTAVGETSVSFPYADVKDTVGDRITDTANNRVETVLPTDATLLGFNELRESLLQNIALATDLDTLYNLKVSGVSQLNSFELIPDPVKFAKRAAETSLLLTLTGNFPTATTASITAMTAAYDAALLTVNAATTETMVATALTNGMAAIIAAYVPDPVKVALAEAKVDYLSYFENICSSIIQMLIYPVDEDAIWVQYDQAEALIQAATSVETVHELTTSAIATLRSSGYMLSPAMFTELEGTRQRIQFIYLMFAQQVLDETGTRSIALDAKYAEIAVEMQTADIYDVLLVYGIGVKELNAIAVSALQGVYPAKIQALVDQYTLVLSPEGKSMLDTHTVFILSLLAEVDWATDYLNIMYDFEIFAHSLLGNMLQTQKLVMIRALEERLINYRLTATPASLIALDSAFAMAQGEVLACLDVPSIDSQYSAWLEMLQNAYDYDAAKLAIQMLREDAFQQIEWIQTGYIDLGMFPGDDRLNNAILEARYAVTDCTEVPDTVVIISTLYSRLASLEFESVPGAITLMKDDLDSHYADVELAVGTLPSSFKTAYDTRYAGLVLQPTLQALVKEYVAIHQMLTDYESIDRNEKAHTYLTSRLDATFPIVIDSEQFDLLTFYNASIAVLDATRDGEVIALVQLRFGDYCATSTIDPLKELRFSQLNYAKERMEEFYPVISAASKTLMQEQYGILYSAVNAETVDTIIENLVNTFVDDLAYLYAEDPVRGELEYVRNVYIRNLAAFGDMTYEVIMYPDSPEAYELDDVLIALGYQLLEATTLATLQTEYNTGMEEVFSALLACDLVDIFTFRAYFEERAEQHYHIIAQMSDPYAEDVMLTLLGYKENLINQITISTDPIEMFIDYLTYVNSSEDALLQSWINSLLATISAKQDYIIQRLSSSMEIGNLIAAVDPYELALNSLFLESSVNYVLVQYEQMILEFTALIDPLKNAKRNAIETIQELLVDYYGTSTAESATAIYAAQTSGYDAIYDATTIVAVETALNDTLAAIDAAYAEDSTKKALLDAINAAILALEEDVDLAMETSYDVKTLNKWLFLDNNWMWAIYAASSMEELNNTLFELQSEIDSISPEYDSDLVDFYRAVKIGEMTDLMDLMYGVLSPENYSNISTYRVTCVNNMNGSVDPFVIRQIGRDYETYVNSLS